MYLGGNLGWAEYHFLQGMGVSTNSRWVESHQKPFNDGYLYPAARLAATDKVAAYNMLAPAFAAIKRDADNFIAQFGSDGQATIDGWKQDWPLIEGFLRDWGQAAAAAAGSAAGAAPPVSLPLAYEQPPAIADSRAPSIWSPASPVATTNYLPAAAPNVTVQTGAAGAPSTIMEWAPWVAGAVVVGLLMSGGRRKGA